MNVFVYMLRALQPRITPAIKKDKETILKHATSTTLKLWKQNNPSEKHIHYRHYRNKMISSQSRIRDAQMKIRNKAPEKNKKVSIYYLTYRAHASLRIRHTTAIAAFSVPSHNHGRGHESSIHTVAAGTISENMYLWQTRNRIQPHLPSFWSLFLFFFLSSFFLFFLFVFFSFYFFLFFFFFFLFSVFFSSFGFCFVLSCFLFRTFFFCFVFVTQDQRTTTDLWWRPRLNELNGEYHYGRWLRHEIEWTSLESEELGTKSDEVNQKHNK